MFDKVKAIIKDVCMKFHNKTKLLYIETNALGVGLKAALLQTKSNTSCHTEMKHWTIASLGSLHFPAKASPVQKKDSAILKEKHYAQCMAY